MDGAVFSFATARQILFGCGTVKKVGGEAARRGRHALLAIGRNTQRAEPLTGMLARSGVAWTLFQVSGEPEIEDVAAGAVLARDSGCDLVIGLGGGSVLDAAKAIAALAVNVEPVETYLEGIGPARPLDRTPLPCIAIPTTAGTGSEVTRNAVLRCPRRRVKVSLRSPEMLPVLAAVDPELTVGLPVSLTAATGADALTQLFEAFVSCKANPISDALCGHALPLVARALPRLLGRGEDLAARTDMALASLFSGLALSNAGLGAVHGIAGPLGGMLAAPHGALCGRLLPHVSAVNVATLRRRDPAGSALARYAEAARLLTGSSRATAEEGIAWLRDWLASLALPSLESWGLRPGAVAELSAAAERASSMQGNPIILTPVELSESIAAALAEGR